MTPCQWHALSNVHCKLLEEFGPVEIASSNMVIITLEGLDQRWRGASKVGVHLEGTDYQPENTWRRFGTPLCCMA